MTRELKLALIVGFALVLLVTVLISDHLSKARKAQLAGNVTDAPTGVATTPNETAPGPVVTINQGTGGGVLAQPALIGPAPTDPNAGLVIKDPAKDPTITSQIANRGGEPMPVGSTLPPMVSLDSASISNGLPSSTPLLPGGPVSGGQTPDGAAMHETRPTLGPGFDAQAQQPLNATTVALDPTAKTSEAVVKKAEEATKPAKASDERWHTVASGESAYSIAKKYYGKGELWTKLKAANGDRMGDKGQVRVGVRLRVPDAPGASSKESPANATAPKSEGKPKDRMIAEFKPAKPAGPRSYTVQKGDTLGTIAQKQLGSSKRMDDILKANKDIRNPNALRVGSKLLLPAA